MPYPAWGHVNPMVPVISELVERGVRVRVVADRRHAGVFRAVGARVVPLSVRPDVRVPAQLSARARRYCGARWRKWMVDRDAASIVRAELVRDRASLVVVDPMMGGADRVARCAGVATAVFSTTYAQGDLVPVWWRRDGAAGRGSVMANRVRGRRLRRDRVVVVNTVPELQPGLAGFGDRFRFLGPLARAEGDTDLAVVGLPTARRVLLVSPGTVFEREAEFFATVVRAFADTSWHVVMSTGGLDPAVLSPLPENVIALRSVPQLAVLRHTEVFLTHAGMNSALEAMTCGVPMVVAPRAGDQRFVARRLVELEMARALPFGPCSSGVVRDAVEKIAADHLARRAANRWRDRLAVRDTVAEAADLLVAQAGLRASARPGSGP